MIISAIIATTAGFVAAHSTAIAVGFELAFAVSLEVEKANETHKKNEDLRERHGMTENRTVIEHMADLAIDYAAPIGYVTTWLTLGLLQDLARLLIVCWKLKFGIRWTLGSLLIMPWYSLTHITALAEHLAYIMLWPAYTANLINFARYATL